MFGRGEEKVASAIRTHIMKTFTCEHDVFLVDNGNVGNVRWRGKKRKEDIIDIDERDGPRTERTTENNNRKNAKDASSETLISVQIHEKRSITYAMRMGVRAADAIGKLKRRPFEAYGKVSIFLIFKNFLYFQLNYLIFFDKNIFRLCRCDTFRFFHEIVRNGFFNKINESNVQNRCNSNTSGAVVRLVDFVLLHENTDSSRFATLPQRVGRKQLL